MIFSRHFAYVSDPAHDEHYIIVIFNMVKVFAYRYEDDSFHYNEDLTQDFCYDHELKYQGISNATSIDFLIDIEYGKETSAPENSLYVTREATLDPTL